jgi:hypothetical protein
MFRSKIVADDGREVIALHRVPAEALYAADGFDLPVLPSGTTALRLAYIGEEAGVQQILPDEMRATRRNTSHVRSFELEHRGDPIMTGVATTLIGAEWSMPGTRHTTGAFSVASVEFFGGMQRSDAEAALEASKKLEEWGVHGERIQRIDAPQVLAWNGNLMEPNEVIGHLVERSEPPEHQALVAQSLRSGANQPVTVIRTAPTDIRLGDIERASRPQLREYLQIGMNKVAGIHGIYEGLHADNTGDVVTYLTEALPRIHGQQLGTIEAHEHQQLYPHNFNIAVDGGIVDLDGIVPGLPTSPEHYIDGVVGGCFNALARCVDLRVAPAKLNVDIEDVIYGSFQKGFYEEPRYT